jgi:hypothetical protein
MKSSLKTSTIAIVSLTQTNAFAPSLLFKDSTRSTQLYGLFDGIKEAFVAPALERSTLDAERETPIDRWMGWNVKSTDSPSVAQGKESFCVCPFCFKIVFELCIYDWNDPFSN